MRIDRTETHQIIFIYPILSSLRGLKTIDERVRFNYEYLRSFLFVGFHGPSTHFRASVFGEAYGLCVRFSWSWSNFLYFEKSGTVHELNTTKPLLVVSSSKVSRNDQLIKTPGNIVGFFIDIADLRYVLSKSTASANDDIVEVNRLGPSQGRVGSGHDVTNTFPANSTSTGRFVS